jgi:hypothetical protein
MTAFTDSFGFNKNSAGYSANYTDRTSVIEVDIDFKKIAAARVAAGVAALAAADTLEILKIPAGSVVLAGGGHLLRAEGGTATVDIGISGTTTQWLNNFNLNTTVGTSAATVTPQFYATETTILMTIDNNDTDNARAKFFFVVVNSGKDQGTIPNSQT